MGKDPNRLTHSTLVPGFQIDVWIDEEKGWQAQCFKVKNKTGRDGSPEREPVGDIVDSLAKAIRVAKGRPLEDPAPVEP